MERIEFGTIAHVKKGKKPLRQISHLQDGYMPYVDIEAFETGNIKAYADGEKCLPCKAGEILIVCDGSRSGFVGRAIDGFVGSTLAIISADGMSADYLYYFLQGKYALLNTKKKGAATPHLDQQILYQQKLIVPSLDEQKRIVARIEELFSKLDSAVETLRKTKQQLAVYRQAVLKDAFDRAGDRELPLKQIIEKPRYGTSKKCSYNVDGVSVPVYRIPNVNYLQGSISHEDLKYATFTQDEFESLRLHSGDILIIRSNGSVSLVGRSAVVTEKDTHGLFAGYLMRLRIKNGVEILPQYLNLYLNTHYARYQIEQMAKSTSGVNNINSNEISRINLPICDVDMQKAIIQEVETRLSVCDSIEKTVDTALQQAEAMRQSILKQAFEGRL